MTTAVKGARSAATGKGTDAVAAIKLAVSQIMRAASKGVIHKKTASRYVSRLSRAKSST